MADGTPFFFPGDSLTGHCTAAVTGQRFVKISANVQADGAYSVAHATAAGASIGVAMRDGAIGDRIPVFTEGVLPVQVGAGAGLSAGDEVEAGAAGVAVVLAAGKRLGVVMADAAASAIAQIKVNL